MITRKLISCAVFSLFIIVDSHGDGKSPLDNKQRSARIGRLLKISMIHSDAQPSERYMRILRRRGNDCDIENDLSKFAIRIVRIWSFGESVDKVRIISITKERSAEVTVKFFPVKPELHYKINPEDLADIVRSINSIIESPISFKKDTESVGSNTVDFIVESLENGKYKWAVREADFSTRRDYTNMGATVDLFTTKESSGK